MSKTFKDRHDVTDDVDTGVARQPWKQDKEHLGKLLRFSMSRYTRARTVERSRRYFAAADRTARCLGVLD